MSDIVQADEKFWRRQRLVEQVQAIAERLDGKQFAIVVWDGDQWCSTVNLGVTKKQLEDAGKFWTTEAEKMP